jgi:hypothetical protein
MSNLTECDYVSKECTKYIKENICKKFSDVWDELIEQKIPPEHVKRGLALTLAYSVNYFTVTEKIGPEVREIMNDVQKIIEEHQKKGVHFAVQSAALEILIPVLLGIDYGDTVD